MRKMTKRPRLDPTEHPRPQVMVPMSIFGETLFNGDHARVGRFVHAWTFAVWKKDPTYRPFHEDDNEDTLRLALFSGFVVKDKKRGYRFTGPSKDLKWLLGQRTKWQTYVVEAVGQDLIKIGKSANVEKRIDGLQVASPHELRVVVVWDGDCESALHRELHDYRVGGEWFRYNDTVRAVISAKEIG